MKLKLVRESLLTIFFSTPTQSTKTNMTRNSRNTNYSGDQRNDNRNDNIFSQEYEGANEFDVGQQHGNGYRNRAPAFPDPNTRNVNQSIEPRQVYPGTNNFNTQDQNSSGETTNAANILTGLHQAAHDPTPNGDVSQFYNYAQPMGSLSYNQHPHQGLGQYGDDQRGSYSYVGGPSNGGYAWGGPQQMVHGNTGYAPMAPMTAKQHGTFQGMGQPYASMHPPSQAVFRAPIGNRNGNMPPTYYSPTPPPVHPQTLAFGRPNDNGFAPRSNWAFGTDTSFGETGYCGQSSYDEEEKAQNLNSVPLADRLSAQPFGRQPPVQPQQPTGPMAAQAFFGPTTPNRNEVSNPSPSVEEAPRRATRGKKKGKRQAKNNVDEEETGNAMMAVDDGQSESSEFNDGIDNPTLLGLPPKPRANKGKGAAKGGAKKKRNVGPACSATTRTKLSAEEKRANHTRSEQERRALKTKMLQVLKEQVPVLDGGRSGHSQAEALDDGANFLEATQNTNNRMEQMLDDLVRRNRQAANMGPLERMEQIFRNSHHKGFGNGLANSSAQAVGEVDSSPQGMESDEGR